MFLQNAGGTASPGAPRFRRVLHPDQRWNPLRSRLHPGNPTPTVDRSRSCPRGCDRSTSMMPTSSWNSCPALGIGTDCPTASGSGSADRADRPRPSFKVGLIYGPSGCGKSSLVKAGLLPRLGKHVLTVYIESTPDETEARLLKGLRKVCPELPRGLGLVDSLATCGGAAYWHPAKVLLVLDQFEQWLHAKRGEETTELVAALRHCDGEHVQAIVMVRDDFWLAASRFMRDLEIRLLEGENIALVDLFDPRHAQKVLTAFGRAYGGCPRTSVISQDQNYFWIKRFRRLAQDGKIISVRLALFAEMVKGKPWTPATLRNMGGTEGIGVTFLEETFAPRPPLPSIAFTRKRPRRF